MWPKWFLMLAIPSVLASARAYARSRADALNECLEAMIQGERDLDALACRYLRERDEIRPLLDVGLELLESAPFSLSVEVPLRRPTWRSGQTNRTRGTLRPVRYAI